MSDIIYIYIYICIYIYIHMPWPPLNKFKLESSRSTPPGGPPRTGVLCSGHAEGPPKVGTPFFRPSWSLVQQNLFFKDVLWGNWR